jgi:uncharacterized protein
MKTIAAAVMFTIATASSALAEGQTHYLAIHVDQNDPQVMNLALNNADNVAEFYAAQGDEVMIEMVAYGPGLNMFVDGKSPVADRIETMALQMQGHITFSACGNTLKKMTAKLGAEPVILAEAQVVPAGVIRLMELQGEGYAYLKP